MYPDSFDNLSQPTPSTIRASGVGISPANTVAALIDRMQVIERRLGLAAAITFTVNTGTDVFTSVAHGMSDTDMVMVSSSGALPAPLATRTAYYVINSAADTFQLSTTRGGSAIDITGTGTGTHSLTVLFSEGKFLSSTTNSRSNWLKVVPAGTVVGTSDAQTLTNKILTLPTIGDFSNAEHDHEDAAGGGVLGVGAVDFIVDEDNMTSNSAVLVPTQQSVKTYVDTIPYKFRAYRSSNVDTADGASYSPIIFNTEIFDTGGIYNNSTGVFTVPVTGYYQLDARLNVTRTDEGSPANTDDTLWGTQARLELVSPSPGDLDYSTIYTYNAGAVTSFAHTFGGIYALTAGDTLKLTATADTKDGAVWRLRGGTSYSWWSVALIGLA